MTRTKLSDPRNIRDRIDPSLIDTYLSEDISVGEIDKIIARLEKIQQKVRTLGYDSAELEMEVEDVGYYEPSYAIQVTLYGNRKETEEEVAKRTKTRVAANKKARETRAKTKRLKEEEDYKKYLKLREKYKELDK